MPEPIGPQHAEVVTVDGEPTLVHGDQPLSPAARDAIATVIRAARAKLREDSDG
ncbi:hypothetical protein [Nocardia wallacei]|uniref:hypothetical protein n=1 Tax=Nocardia wallacei TaxID=480035 RepID=UPI002455B857|nr:hypothetical protein [Nocardia wallacei]